MLISCPKCHSIYEIPDNIIKKTGTNLRCHACGNIWHAMLEDALDYQSEADEEPYIEPIEVKEPPYRHYPANKKNYTIPADTRSGVRTKSSAEIRQEAGVTEPQKKQDNKEEITLTSDLGTSFTISTTPEYQETDDIKKMPWLNHKDEIRPQAEDRLRPEKSFRGYKKSCTLLAIVLLALLAIFLRRDIVSIYPQAEDWYNKIHLSGMQNMQYLRFNNVNISQQIIDNKEYLHIEADIVNTSRYWNIVPPISINDSEQTFQVDRAVLKAKESAHLNITVKAFEQNKNQGLTLHFVHP